MFAKYFDLPFLSSPASQTARAYLHQPFCFSEGATEVKEMS